MTRRAMLLLVAMGMALAASITCAENPCLGTSDPDVIDGTNDAETIKALASNDVVAAYSGNDTVYGNEGNDFVHGFGGNDTIYGGPDGDGTADGTGFGYLNLEGGQDSDKIYGGGGNDYIDAAFNDIPEQFPTAEPVDRSYGGRGNDVIEARDGNKDIISCGRGEDVVYVDFEEDRKHINYKTCELAIL